VQNLVLGFIVVGLILTTITIVRLAGIPRKSSRRAAA
jgi:hypothetical protein